MQIQQVKNYSTSKASTNPQFKAVYPVVHWVAETNGSYAPVVSMELTRKLQRILVGVLNHSKKSNCGTVGMFIENYISKCDLDYRRHSIARTFYDKKGGFNNKKFIPFAHLITGEDFVEFNSSFGKAIGEAKSNAPRQKGKPISAELKQVVHNYNLGGWQFVNDKKKKLYDNAGIAYALHTKFQTIRSKTGKIKGYELVDAKFCPEKGAKNPFVRTGIVSVEDLEN